MITLNPSKHTRCQRPSAVGSASERSERGRSTLFKNPLFFSGKFLGCYIEAAQNFIRYVTIFDRDRGQKTSLTKLVFSGEFLGCYIEAAQNFIRYVTIFDRDRGQKTSLTKLLLKCSVLKQSLPNSQRKLL